MPATAMPHLRSILARDAMHAPILAVDPSASLGDVAAVMGGHRVHCVIVDGVRVTPEGEHLVWGVISDLDLMKAAVADDPALTAGTIAGSEAVVVDAADDLESVCRMLVNHDCSHVVVVADGRPAGVISTLDIASVLAD